jgi:peroxiredoxin
VFSLDPLKGLARAAIFAFALASASSGDAVASNNSTLARVNIGAPAPPFSANGADGHRHSLRDYAGQLVVLEWTSPVCPFTATRYKSGAMQALQRYAASHGVVWLSIDTAAPDRAGYLTPLAARTRIAQTQAKVTEFLFDTDGSIARSYGAKTTPSFFIVDRDGKLAYEGAMDADIFDNSGGGRDYVQAALDDLVAGRAVKDAQTQPQGCAIEYSIE